MYVLERALPLPSLLHHHVRHMVAIIDTYFHSVHCLRVPGECHSHERRHDTRKRDALLPLNFAVRHDMITTMNTNFRSVVDSKPAHRAGYVGSNPV